jgi:hypothetical protein
MTRSIQVSRELSELGGVLTPADDPDPSTPLCAAGFKDDLKIYLGDGMAHVMRGGFPFYPIGTIKQTPEGTLKTPLVTIDKDEDGNIVVTADVRNMELKRVALVDRNTFEISESKIFRTHRERPDKHTLDIYDEYGNEALYVRYLNSHAVKLSGILYYLPGEAATIKGEKVGSQFAHEVCLVVGVPGQMGVGINLDAK